MYVNSIPSFKTDKKFRAQKCKELATNEGLVRTMPEELDNAALFLGLGLPSTLIRHENGAFPTSFPGCLILLPRLGEPGETLGTPQGAVRRETLGTRLELFKNALKPEDSFSFSRGQTIGSLRSYYGDNVD